MKTFANISDTSSIDCLASSTPVTVNMVAGQECKPGGVAHNITPADVKLLRDVAHRWHFPSVAGQEQILNLADRLSQLWEQVT